VRIATIVARATEARGALGRECTGEQDEHAHRDVAARVAATALRIHKSVPPTQPSLPRGTRRRSSGAPRTDRLLLRHTPPRRGSRERERARSSEGETDREPAGTRRHEPAHIIFNRLNCNRSSTAHTLPKLHAYIDRDDVGEHKLATGPNSMRRVLVLATLLLAPMWPRHPRWLRTSSSGSSGCALEHAGSFVLTMEPIARSESSGYGWREDPGQQAAAQVSTRQRLPRGSRDAGRGRRRWHRHFRGPTRWLRQRHLRRHGGGVVTR
jgi:hypothetical protein